MVENIHIGFEHLAQQASLFPQFTEESAKDDAHSSTFTDNMRLPIHRWFRYSAGFSARWVESVIDGFEYGRPNQILDPFVGSATTLIAAQKSGIQSWGIEAHPFVYRIAHAKLAWTSDPELYRVKMSRIIERASTLRASLDGYPELIHKCYDSSTLSELDVIRQALELERDASSEFELSWLTFVSTLRKVSSAGTAQWQYILPSKPKKAPLSVDRALHEAQTMIYGDMRHSYRETVALAHILQSDARTCEGVPERSIDLVITSPPYPNNYDYADATRLEMSFMQEISGWGDLHDKVRKYLMRSCSQHTPERTHSLKQILDLPALDPVRCEMEEVCEQLSKARMNKGGKKTYHLMVAAYFRDIALVWQALRRVCASPSQVCFVIGDSAPYGVYVPVISWMEKLAVSSGFDCPTFEKTRDRNIKWKNRKHRVPLQEGRFWVRG